MPAADTDGPDRAERACPTCGETFPASFSLCPHDASRLYAADQRPGDRLIGVVLGNTYRITEVLGEGGMARIYAAEHVRLGSRWAVKVIHDEIASKPEMLARFEREARAGSKIRSDHVVSVIDVLHTPDGRPCIISELLEGEDLKQLLDRSDRLPPRQALEIARQLCRAVSAAHAEGVIHRDLKPSNVFLTGADDELVVKVLDFGVAKLDDDAELTKTGALVGTLSYMAPEQAKRAADASTLSDIYTLGAVIYHMVTGQPPYGNDPAINPLILLLGSEPESPRAIDPKIPVGVEAVIQRAMAREPEQRPQTADELEDELAVFARRIARRKVASPSADGEDAPATPAPKRSRSRVRAGTEEAEAIVRGARRARPFAVIVAVAATLLVGCYVAALMAALLTSQIEPRTGGERTMIGLIGLAASGVVGWVHFYSLRSRWNSLPAVQAFTRIPARALLAGLLALGFLQLLVHGLYAVRSTPPLVMTGSWTFRLIVTGVAAGLGLAWPRVVRAVFKS